MGEEAVEESIFGDMANLEKILRQDHSGERARAMIHYFGVVSDASRRLQVKSRDESQRHLVGQLVGGFEAAERIIRKVWETIHASALAV